MFAELSDTEILVHSLIQRVDEIEMLFSENVIALRYINLHLHYFTI